MKLRALVAMTPALALGAVLLVPSVAAADHHRSSDRGRRSADGRSYRSHDRSQRQGYDRGHRKHDSRWRHQRYGRYERPPRYRYRYSYRPHPRRRVFRPTPPVVYAPPPGYWARPPAYYGPRGRAWVPGRPYRGGVHGSVSVGLPFFGLYVRF
jgi:hypothetical protein